MSLNEDFIGQNLESKVGCPTKFFSKTKNICIDHEKNVKEIQKNPVMGPVPGPKVIFTTIFTLKIQFFFNFLFTFFSWSMYIFFVFEKWDNHFQFCPIKSSFK